MKNPFEFDVPRYVEFNGNDETRYSEGWFRVEHPEHFVFIVEDKINKLSNEGENKNLGNQKEVEKTLGKKVKKQREGSRNRRTGGSQEIFREKKRLTQNSTNHNRTVSKDFTPLTNDSTPQRLKGSTPQLEKPSVDIPTRTSQVEKDKAGFKKPRLNVSFRLRPTASPLKILKQPRPDSHLLIPRDSLPKLTH